jgi:hypothetical protein
LISASAENARAGPILLGRAATSLFIRPGGGVRSATSGRRTQGQLARAVWARSLRTGIIGRIGCDNDGTNSRMSQGAGTRNTGPEARQTTSISLSLWLYEHICEILQPHFRMLFRQKRPSECGALGVLVILGKDCTVTVQ